MECQCMIAHSLTEDKRTVSRQQCVRKAKLLEIAKLFEMLFPRSITLSVTKHIFQEYDNAYILKSRVTRILSYNSYC